jgi:hypothetical protein
MASYFYDSVSPLLIPGKSAACLYYDGLYRVGQPVPVNIASRFSAIRWITVLGDYVNCGIADYEAGNEVYSIPGELRKWVQGRLAKGMRARVYCDRSNIESVREETAGLHHEWWIATLDGNQLSKDYLPNMWGVQYLGNNRYDESILYGAW